MRTNFKVLAIIALALVAASCDKVAKPEGPKAPESFKVTLPDDLEELDLDYSNQSKTLDVVWETQEGASYKFVASLDETLVDTVCINLNNTGEDVLTHAQLDELLEQLGVKAYRRGEVFWAIEGNIQGLTTMSETRSMRLFRFYGPFTDARDGEVYRVCRVVNKESGDYMVWLADNIRATKYSDGTAIAATEMKFNVDAADASDKDKEWNRLRGGYYTWAATVRDVTAAESGQKVQGIAPDGWHIATRDEWIFLLNSQEDETKPLLSLIDKTYWGENALAYNNKCGFNAVAAGYVWSVPNGDGIIENTQNANFWTSTMPVERDVIPWNPPASEFPNQACVYSFNFSEVGHSYYVYARDRGYSVRCVLDD